MELTRYDEANQMSPHASQWFKKYEFSPEVLDIIVSGTSAIDANFSFEIRNHDDAERYLKGYGFTIENPIEQAELTGHYHEALNFIRRYFLHPENPDGLRLEVPRKILELTDIRDLFLMASRHLPGQTTDTAGMTLRNWACAILKVMHTIAHIDQDIRTGTFADVQKQIFDRFYKVVHRDADEKLFLGEKADDFYKVPLVGFETKPKKSRDSILLKLLHKPENVAEDIFDRIGVRFITENKLDALRVVKFLKQRRIVMPPNIKPSRSRNSLVSISLVKSAIESLASKIEREEISEEQFVKEVESKIGSLDGSGSANVHTSDEYKSMQFTCRQLIKLRNPLYDTLKELKSHQKDKDLSEPVGKLIDKIEFKYLPREVRFFYPVEVQILDRESAINNEKGRSAHSEYKKSQIQTALKRVMGQLGEITR